jgi:transcriptional regulator with XRE-family HTH domain
VEVEERKRIGARISQARRETGLTQRELAGRLGITTRSLQNYESGAIVPYRHLQRIEVIARKRAGWLLQSDGDGRELLQTIEELHAATEQHYLLLRDHVQALREQTERLREQREASAERRSHSGA